MKHVTNKPLDMNLWGAFVTIKEGTPVILIKGADGLRGDMFAVADPRYLMDLTGNKHDPIYRYVFIENEHVSEVKTFTIRVEAVTTYEFQVHAVNEEDAREDALVIFPENADVSQWEKGYDWNITSVDEIE